MVCAGPLKLIDPFAAVAGDQGSPAVFGDAAGDFDRAALDSAAAPQSGQDL